jgi:RNA polymerase sigma-70 factor (ECF subfamily)
VHVINHTAQSRSVRITDQDREDVAAEIFLALVRDDFAVLRHFRGQSSLATYLTVVARRVVVRELMKRKSPPSLGQSAKAMAASSDYHALPVEQRISDREEVEQLLAQLNAPEAEVVRMYHLEGASYREISHKVGMPENSIGPTLSRARSKMRRARADSPS